MRIQNYQNKTNFMGRWQVLNKSPKVVLDVCHNFEGFKTIIKQNKRIKLDHFILINDNEFKPNFKNFWESPYELIIFDNYPIQPLSPNLIRVLGKKIISNQSGLMHLTGPNQNTNSLNRINTIGDVI